MWFGSDSRVLQWRSRREFRSMKGVAVSVSCPGPTVVESDVTQSVVGESVGVASISVEKLVLG